MVLRICPWTKRGVYPLADAIGSYGYVESTAHAGLGTVLFALLVTVGIQPGRHLHQLRQRTGLHLSHDASSMRLHRDFADAQLAADLLVEQPGYD